MQLDVVEQLCREQLLLSPSPAVHDCKTHAFRTPERFEHRVPFGSLIIEVDCTWKSFVLHKVAAATAGFEAL